MRLHIPWQLLCDKVVLRLHIPWQLLCDRMTTRLQSDRWGVAIPTSRTKKIRLCGKTEIRLFTDQGAVPSWRHHHGIHWAVVPEVIPPGRHDEVTECPFKRDKEENKWFQSAAASGLLFVPMGTAEVVA